MLTYAELQDIRDRHAVALSLPAGAEAMRLLATYAIPTLFSHIADQAEALKAEKEQSVRLFGHNGDLAAENHQLRSQLQQVQADVASLERCCRENDVRYQDDQAENRDLQAKLVTQAERLQRVQDERDDLHSYLEAAQAEVAAVRRRAKEGLERKQGELEELRRLFHAYIDMRDSDSMSWAFMGDVQKALRPKGEVSDGNAE